MCSYDSIDIGWSACKDMLTAGEAGFCKQQLVWLDAQYLFTLGKSRLGA